MNHRRHTLRPLLPLLLLSSLACASTKTDPPLEYNEAARVEFRKPEKPVPLTFEEEVRVADRLRDSGQLPEAAWHYVRSMQLDGSSPLPKQRLGYLQLSNDVDRADMIFRELVEDHPEIGSAHLGLGLARVVSGRHLQARPSLLRALDLDPSLATAHVGLGMIHDKLGEHDLAQMEYEVASEQDPRRYEIKNNLGMSHLMSGNFGQAAQSFRDAIYLEPRDPTLYNNLAIAMARQGDYRGAYRSFRHNSNEADALNNLGYVSLVNGDFERAIKYFERSLLEGPSQRARVLVNMRAAEDALLTDILRTD
jgi:Flp pilus assembly protein TadD